MLDFLPSFCFRNTPSFQDFILAAQNIKSGDALVLKNGRLVKKLHYEENEEKLNRQTWSAFSRAVKNSPYFSSKKREHICARYGFDWNKMVYSSLPCERRYLEYFGIGAACAYSYNLSERIPNSFRTLNQFPPEKIHQFYVEATNNSYLGKVEDPSIIHGAPRDTHENFTHDFSRVDQQRCNLFRGIAELISKDPNIPRLHPYYSRLSMGIISLLETKNDIKDIEIVIPAPAAREGELDYYKVYNIISYGGLTAVALVPISDKSSLSPILAFRCTKQTMGQTDAIPSLLNDMELHMGESGYSACRKYLQTLMEDRKFNNGKKITVLSYSLGGGHASYFMRDHWRYVREFIGFNYVGNDARIIESLAQEINESPPNVIPPSFYLHRNVCNEPGTLGDWVNKTGQKHIGWGIKHPNSRVQLYEWLIHDYPVPSENVYDPIQFWRWLEIHGVRPMDAYTEDAWKSKYNTKFKYHYTLYRGHTLCDPILDTYNRDNSLEDKRLQIGYHLMYRIVNTVYSLVDFIFRALGIDFFKKNP